MAATPPPTQRSSGGAGARHGQELMQTLWAPAQRGGLQGPDSHNTAGTSAVFSPKVATSSSPSREPTASLAEGHVWLPGAAPTLPPGHPHAHRPPAAFPRELPPPPQAAGRKGCEPARPSRRSQTQPPSHLPGLQAWPHQWFETQWFSSITGRPWGPRFFQEPERRVGTGSCWHHPPLAPRPWPTAPGGTPTPSWHTWNLVLGAKELGRPRGHMGEEQLPSPSACCSPRHPPAQGETSASRAQAMGH